MSLLLLLLASAINLCYCDIVTVGLDSNVRVLAWRTQWYSPGIELTLLGTADNFYEPNVFYHEFKRNPSFSQIQSPEYTGYILDFNDCLDCIYVFFGAYRPVATMWNTLRTEQLPFNYDYMIDVYNKMFKYKKMTIYEDGETYAYQGAKPDIACTGEIYGICGYAANTKIYTGQTCVHYYYPIICFEDLWDPADVLPTIHIITTEDRLDVVNKPDTVIFHPVSYPVQVIDRQFVMDFFDTLPVVTTYRRLYDPARMIIDSNDFKYITFFGDSRTANAFGFENDYGDYDCSRHAPERYLTSPFLMNDDDLSYVFASSGRSVDACLYGNVMPVVGSKGRRVINDHIFIYIGINLVNVRKYYGDLDDTYTVLLDVLATASEIELLDGLGINDQVIAHKCKSGDGLLTVVYDGKGPCTVICNGETIFTGITSNLYSVLLDLPTGVCTSSCAHSGSHLCHSGFVSNRAVVLVQSPTSCTGNYYDWQKYQATWCESNPNCFYVPTVRNYYTDSKDCVHAAPAITKIICDAVENFVLYINGGLPLIRVPDSKLMFGDTSPLVVGTADYLSYRKFYDDPKLYDACPCPMKISVNTGKSFFRSAYSVDDKIGMADNLCNRIGDHIVECSLLTVRKDANDNGIYEFLVHSKKPYKSSYLPITSLLSNRERASSVKDLVGSTQIRGVIGSCAAYYAKPCEIVFAHKGYAVLQFSYNDGEKNYGCHEEIDFTSDISLYSTCKIPDSITQPVERTKASDIYAIGAEGDNGEHTACVVGSCNAGYFVDGPSGGMGGFYCCRYITKLPSCEIQFDYEGTSVVVNLKTDEAKYTITSSLGNLDGTARAAHSMVLELPEPGAYNIYVTCGSNSLSRDIVCSIRDYCDSKFPNFMPNLRCKYPRVLYALIAFSLIFLCVLIFKLLITYVIGNMICTPLTSCVAMTFGISCKDCGASVSRSGKINHSELCPSRNISGSVIREATRRGNARRSRWIGDIVSNSFLLTSFAVVLVLVVHIVSIEAVSEFEVPDNLDNIEKLWKGLAIDGFTPSSGIFKYNPDSTYQTIQYEFNDKKCTDGVCTAVPQFRFPGPFIKGEQWYFKAGDLDIVLRVSELHGISEWKKIYKTCKTEILSKSTTSCSDNLETCEGCLSEVVSDEMSLLNPYTYFVADTAPAFIDLYACTTIHCKFRTDHCTCFACANKPTSECGDVFKLVRYTARMKVCISVNGKVVCDTILENKDTDSVISKIYASSPYTRFAYIDATIKAGSINDWGIYSNQFGSIQIVDGKVYGQPDPAFTTYCTAGYARMFVISQCLPDTWSLHENLEIVNIYDRIPTGFISVIDQVMGEFAITFPTMVVSGGRSAVKVNRLEDLSCRGCFGCSKGVYCELIVDAAGSGIATLSSNPGCTLIPPKFDLQEGSQRMSFNAFCVKGIEVCLNISNIRLCTAPSIVDAEGPISINSGGSSSLEDLSLDLSFDLPSLWSWLTNRLWYVVGVIAIFFVAFLLLTLLCNFATYQRGYVRFKSRTKKSA